MKPRASAWHDIIQAASAVVTAAIASVGAYYLFEEAADREQSRITRAWTLYHHAKSDPRSAHKNVGQIEAVETLYRSGANLIGIDLSNLYLSGLDLACLKASIFSSRRCADLSGSSFRNSVLERVDFNGARLIDIDVLGANIRYANLHSAIVRFDQNWNSSNISLNFIDEKFGHSYIYYEYAYFYPSNRYTEFVDTIIRRQCRIDSFKKFYRKAVNSRFTDPKSNFAPVIFAGGVVGNCVQAMDAAGFGRNKMDFRPLIEGFARKDWIRILIEHDPAYP